MQYGASQQEFRPIPRHDFIALKLCGFDKSEPKVTEFAKMFLQRWTAGSLEASKFTNELLDSTFIGEVETFLAQQKEDPKLEVLARFEKDGLNISRYRLKFTFVRALLEIARNHESKIAYLLIHPA